MHGVLTLIHFIGKVTYGPPYELLQLGTLSAPLTITHSHFQIQAYCWRGLPSLNDLSYTEMLLSKVSIHFSMKDVRKGTLFCTTTVVYKRAKGLDFGAEPSSRCTSLFLLNSFQAFRAAESKVVTTFIINTIFQKQ